MLAKNLRDILFGKTLNKINKVGNSRRTDITFPAVDDNDVERHFSYATDDGLILYLIKRIEKLEERALLNEGKFKIKK